MDLAERIAWHMVGPGVAQVVARAIAQSTRLAGVDRPCAQLAQRTAPIELSVGRYSAIPGYVSGYGCPVCGAIGFQHVTVEELPA